jgi:formylglycine-generating enzyme required for sulfatase activity
MEMMYIPAGEFQMGSVDGGSDEQPMHTVYLDYFWIDQTEVTNGFYAKCIDAGVCHSHGSDRISNYYNHPVASIINWEDAEKYCAWVGARLPTEAEWEKAARGGLTGKKYPWGDESPTCTKDAKNGAHVSGCSDSEVTTEVKSFAPNGYGLYDMAGNVWEWVADWYDSNYYSISPSSNPQGPSSGQSRVLRGGTWNVGAYPQYRFSFTYENYGRITIRGTVVPPFALVSIGFRCARSAP